MSTKFDAIFVKVRLSDLPETAEVTGRALKDGGYDARQEKNADTTVLEFRRERLSAVLEKLKTRSFDSVVLDDLRL